MSLNKNINTVQDYQDVLDVVEGYVQGLKTGNVEQLRKTFYKDAVMYGHLGSDLSQGSIENLYTYVEKYGAAPNIVTNVTVLHKTPTTATVRVEMEHDAADEDFTDYHSLIKINGEWKVVAKLFHLYNK
ncbi:nuclear transport factor 2 family protein [Chryseobacterium sp. WG14]|uniref:nuclear transport factor 2 family protein n=1 Tax=unclassified Chryseobacterium TaxID=2593645 RepID=UPI00211EB833|nr:MULTISPECIES: nuclear transport factor 2 family protein [unclassified Chryseobacterium]MCQ9636354.1 nuclear transport factor 2 family protein [Chryseobacterium sp. WG23]MCQ9641526.1 nuclear transport factor 2 family protein [Chryseobacterium sp. WG14]